MDNSVQTLDWTLVQAFVAVAEEGSLSGAARRLGTSQPTLGRHIKSLEAAVEAELFRRQPRGLILTEAGVALLTPAKRMRDAARDIALTAAGQGGRLEGTVRVTASIFMAQHMLPRLIAKMRQAEPRIAIELVATDDTENLLFREADIAIRMFRSTQLDIITKHLGDIPLGMFAARSYLDRAGTPATIAEALQHQFVGYDRNEQIILGLRDRGINVGREFFGTRCDVHTVYWELIRAGCGIGFGQVTIAKDDDTLVRLLPEIDIDPLPVWIAAHETMRQNPRIRRVWDMLAEGLPPLIS